MVSQRPSLHELLTNRFHNSDHWKGVFWFRIRNLETYISAILRCCHGNIVPKSNVNTGQSRLWSRADLQLKKLHLRIYRFLLLSFVSTIRCISPWVQRWYNVWQRVASCGLETLISWWLNAACAFGAYVSNMRVVFAVLNETRTILHQTSWGCSFNRFRSLR